MPPIPSNQAATTQPTPFQPLGTRIFVRRDVAPTTTSGGLHLPETAQRPATDRGTVIAVGPGGIGPHGKWVRVSVEVGDVVLFNRQCVEFDMPVASGGTEKLTLVQEHEILGVAAATTKPRRGRPVGAKTSKVTSKVMLSNVRVTGDVAGRDIVGAKASATAEKAS